MRTRLFGGLLWVVVVFSVQPSSAALILTWNTSGNLGTETTENSTFNATGIGTSQLKLGTGVTALHQQIASEAGVGLIRVTAILRLSPKP